jgi:hypothetical protein
VATRDTFEDWAESLGIDRGDDRERRRPDSFDRWLHALFDRGRVTEESVIAAYLLELIERTRQNLTVVLADIERTTELRPDIIVDDYEGTIRVSVDGSYQTPSVTEWTNPEALAELADYLQDQLTEEPWRAWPVCPEHHLGLYTEVHDHRAVWWCRSGDHPVAPVGALPPEAG